MQGSTLNPTDVIVGQNIRIFRQKAKLSQTELGERIGVTFQQVQKYEKGTNRVGASRLARIAHALKVPIPLLFEGVKEKYSANVVTPQDLLTDPGAFKLVEAFAEISNAELRRSIVHLVTSIAHKGK
jgi:transcriptional regulator with XRE-family HTH domain